MEQKKSTEIFVDNQAAISIANNPVSHGKTTFQDQALFLEGGAKEWRHSLSALQN